MYYQGEIEKKDRRKVILIATAIVVVVLILIAAIIVVATKKSGNNVGGNENATFSIDNNKEEEKKEEEKPATSVGSVSTTTAKVETPVNNTSDSIPSTGPEDILPVALALGCLTTAGTAYAMSCKKR